MKLKIVVLTMLTSLSSLLFGLDRANEKKILETLQVGIQIPGSWVSDWRTWVEGLNKLGAFKQPRNQMRTLQHVDRPLHTAFPGLNAIDHVSLCSLPTPLVKLNSLSTELRHPIYIKCDDQTGGRDEQGNFRYGGNKRRKLEYLAGNALALGCTDFITFGCAGSNHALCTSHVARELGCQAHCLLAPQPNSTVVQQNLLSHLIAGSDLHYHMVRSLRCTHAVLMWLDIYHTKGTFPYVIPTGGSNEIGTLGFVNAGFELKEQIDQGIMQEPSRIYVPCGSCATTLGLALGCKLAGIRSTIVAVGVEPEDEPHLFRNNMTILLQKTLALMQSYDASVPNLSIDDLTIEIRTDFSGTNYGLLTPEGRQAMNIMAQLEQLNLDGTYTAKACAAMIWDVQNNKVPADAPVLLWNTYCGLLNQEQLKSVSHEKLPHALQHYFHDPVQ